MTTSAVDLHERFRDAMASVCTPVAVITSQREGLPFGTTVSAFLSLSMSPPIVLVSLDRRSALLEVITQERTFGVNVLSSEQSALAANFAAGTGAKKFTGVEWSVDSDVPRLPETVGFASCRVTEIVDGGDHLVLLGMVVAAAGSSRPPLTYHRRTFGSHGALEEQPFR